MPAELEAESYLKWRHLVNRLPLDNASASPSETKTSSEFSTPLSGVNTLLQLSYNTPLASRPDNPLTCHSGGCWILLAIRSVFKKCRNVGCCVLSWNWLWILIYWTLISKAFSLFIYSTGLSEKLLNTLGVSDRPTLKLNPCTIHSNNVVVNQCDLLSQNAIQTQLHNQSVIDYFNISNFCTNKVRKFSNSPWNLFYSQQNRKNCCHQRPETPSWTWRNRK